MLKILKNVPLMQNVQKWEKLLRWRLKTRYVLQKQRRWLVLLSPCFTSGIQTYKNPALIMSSVFVFVVLLHSFPASFDVLGMPPCVRSMKFSEWFTARWLSLQNVYPLVQRRKLVLMLCIGIDILVDFLTTSSSSHPLIPVSIYF